MGLVQMNVRVPKKTDYLIWLVSVARKESKNDTVAKACDEFAENQPPKIKQEMERLDRIYRETENRVKEGLS